MTGDDAGAAGRPPESVPTVARFEGEPSYAAFEKRSIVGTGSNATVSEATVGDGSGRVVALKEPHVPEDAGQAIADRFRTEAETWSGLNDHDHVITVLAWDADPHPWIALEYMGDGNLVDRAEECDIDQGLWIGARVAAAVDHAHQLGVAHLDLKPENVLFRASSDGSWAIPKVADWGLAAFLHPETTNLEGLSPRYAAPEQFAPDRYGSVDVQTDVYQLGVVLYELLVGEAPFNGPPQVLQNAVLNETPPAPSGRNPTLSTTVDDVLDRALAKDPADRYDSMAAFQHELERLVAVRTQYEPSDVVGTPESDDRNGTLDSARELTVSTTAATSPYERALTLADEGFVQLSERYFARRDPAPPLAAWRRGVRLVDAHAGRAVERVVARDGEDGAGRTSLTDLLIDELRSGTDQIVLGPPGSGKSTVCKQVACEWFNRGYGPVFYRESRQSERFDRPDALGRHVTDTAGHALVVVEDAVRPEAEAVFAFLGRVADSEGVTVLLDAREVEWRETSRGTDSFGIDPATRGREALDPVYVPRPDAREHERFVRVVGAATDRSIEIDTEQLQTEIREAAASDSDGDGTQPGELFYLLHRLSALARDPFEGSDAPTTLTDAVADVSDQLAEVGEEALDVGICMNACNAAGVGVHPELLYAVVPDDPLAVDDAIDVLDGRAVFPHEADWSDGTTAYPAVHGAWSMAFLVHCLDTGGEDAARERFGRVLTRVLSLADDPAGRKQVSEALNADAPYLARIESDLAAWADETAEAVYGLGRDRPKLSPLFGDGERDSIELPAACSDRIVEKRSVWLGRMFLAGGYYKRAERAFERLPQDTNNAVERLLGLARVATNRGDYDDAEDYAERCLTLVKDADRPVVRARARMRLGQAVSETGDYEAAATHYRAALDGFEAVDDRRRMAEALKNIGTNAGRRSEYDQARDHFERCLEIARELGDRQQEGEYLGNLGIVAQHQGEFRRSREYHKRSIEAARELGDRQREAYSFANLGNVTKSQGEYDRARECFERSIEIAQELGDRQVEAYCLGNLGIVTQRQGELSRAREYHERSLGIKRELGDRNGEANSLNNLGRVACWQGEYDQASDYLEQDLKIARELGDRGGEANTINNLGLVALRQGEYDQAIDTLEQALDIAKDIDDPFEASMSQYQLGEVARQQGEYDRARECFEQALDAGEDDGDPFETTKVWLARGRLALARGDIGLAREQTEETRETFGDMGATHWEARSRRLMGRVAAEADEPETAREHWRAALETFETVGASQDALATLEQLVKTCRETGDGDQTGQWCRRAKDLLEAAPEPVADQHREWVRCRCSDSDHG